MTEKNENVIALLGQPNSGKSTLFNGLTGLRQHVGNWPGKTVEKKEGSFEHDGKKYLVADLPGTYSLSANSDEEMITRDYIASGKADVVCILADSSQLERSLYMLADFAGIEVPCFLILNMSDVAADQGKTIDAKEMEKKLGIPVILFSAPDTKSYEPFYKTLEKSIKDKTILKYDALEKRLMDVPEYADIRNAVGDLYDGYRSPMWLSVKALESDEPVIAGLKSKLSDGKISGVGESNTGIVKSGECKFAWIDEIISGSVTNKKKDAGLGKFDRLITHKIWGKPVVVLTILLGLLASFIPALPFMGIGSALGNIPGPLNDALVGAGCPAFIAAILCDVLIRCLSFVIQMLGFVIGVTFVFGLLEEIGVMARISYVFDNTMAKFGLQGKSVMPFLISFGCTMGGAAGTRVIDNWGQKVLTIALSWAIPCGAAWAVIPMLSTLFFGAWTPVIITVILLVMILHMWITAKIFGRSLVKPSDRYGMIMELPPYHKPKWGSLLRYVFGRTKETFIRSSKVVLIVAFVFWLLAYTSSGNPDNSILFKFGRTIEPVTMLFGMKWQTFVAFIASSLGKEGALGVLSTIYSGTGSITIASMQSSEVVSNLNELLLANIPKPEALAFIFAITFNMPCIVALAATYQETHSAKWTAIIGGYYTATALVLAGIAYHIGLLIW
ncbi:ferrous iron transport protein B [Ruminococcaceae bacterium KH2T8]|nr:ferrous iron transport protein B [Ruminococcaceae bacterium KH2T8]